jgi:ferric-dicitrate binding protein FerR (iron transport regulator)
MRLFSLLGLILMNISLVGAATVIRDKKKMELTSDYMMKAGDEIHSGKSKVTLGLQAGSKLQIAKQSKIVVSHYQITKAGQKEKAIIDIDLLKGSLNAKVHSEGNQEIEFKINTPGASFAADEADAEVMLDKSKSASVKVTKGQVLVSSPFIQSFAPEVVKAGEKLRFDMKKKAYIK